MKDSNQMVHRGAFPVDYNDVFPIKRKDWRVKLRFVIHWSYG